MEAVSKFIWDGLFYNVLTRTFMRVESPAGKCKSFRKNFVFISIEKYESDDETVQLCVTDCMM